MPYIPYIITDIETFIEVARIVCLCPIARDYTYTYRPTPGELWFIGLYMRAWLTTL